MTQRDARSPLPAQPRFDDEVLIDYVLGLLPAGKFGEIRVAAQSDVGLTCRIQLVSSRLTVCVPATELALQGVRTDAAQPARRAKLRRAATAAATAGALLAMGWLFGYSFTRPAHTDRDGPRFEVASTAVGAKRDPLLGGNAPPRNFHLTVEGVDRKTYLTVVLLHPGSPPRVFPDPGDDPFPVEPKRATVYGPLDLPKSAARAVVVLTEKPIDDALRNLLRNLGGESEAAVREHVRSAAVANRLTRAVVSGVNIDPKDAKFRPQTP